MKSKIRGFTLTETLIYIGILAIFLIVLTQAFTSVLTSQLQSESTSNIAQDVRYVFARLTYDLLRASSIGLPAILGASGNTLQITLAGLSTYSINGSGNLQVVNNTGTDVLNSYDTSLSNLQFTRLGNAGGKNSIKVNFTITSRTQVNGSYETKNVSTTIGTR